MTAQTTAAKLNQQTSSKEKTVIIVRISSHVLCCCCLGRHGALRPRRALRDNPNILGAKKGAGRGEGGHEGNFYINVIGITYERV